MPAGAREHIGQGFDQDLRLVGALDEAAEREPDEERKGFLRKAAAYLGNTGRDLAVEIEATAINRQMGM